MMGCDRRGTVRAAGSVCPGCARPGLGPRVKGVVGIVCRVLGCCLEPGPGANSSVLLSLPPHLIRAELVL